MQFHNYRPDLMGSVEIDPAGRFDTGTFAVSPIPGKKVKLDNI